jgi:hypothetical protein
VAYAYVLSSRRLPGGSPTARRRRRSWWRGPSSWSSTQLQIHVYMHTVTPGSFSVRGLAITQALRK